MLDNASAGRLGCTGPAQRDRHHERPLAQADILEAKPAQDLQELPADRSQFGSLRREEVLGPHGMAVSGVAHDEALLDESIQRAAERVARGAQFMDERHELGALEPVQLGEDRHRPAVVEEGDEVLDLQWVLK